MHLGFLFKIFLIHIKQLCEALRPNQHISCYMVWFEFPKVKGDKYEAKKTLFHSVADLILAKNYRYFSWSYEEILGIAFVSQDEMVWWKCDSDRQ